MSIQSVADENIELEEEHKKQNYSQFKKGGNIYLP
jgi:hypothetical protein